MAIPLLEAIDIEGKDITADALLTQRDFAEYLVSDRKAHYLFTVKGNQPRLLEDLQLFFQDRDPDKPHFVLQSPPDHGRIETRKIWTTTELNDYLDFPHVGQAFVIERHSIEKKTGKLSLDLPTASPAALPNKPTRNAFSWSIAAIGPSRIAATTSSIGTTMKIAAASARATARRISPASAASPLASSSPKESAASPRKCGNSRATSAWSSTICA